MNPFRMSPPPKPSIPDEPETKRILRQLGLDLPALVTSVGLPPTASFRDYTEHLSERGRT